LGVGYAGARASGPAPVGLSKTGNAGRLVIGKFIIKEEVMSANVIQFDPEKLCKPGAVRPWRGDAQEQRRAANTAANANRWARERGLPGTLTTYGVTAMLELAGGKCIYCEQPARPEQGPSGALGIDHVVPFAAGGVNELSNVVPACLSCNATKHDRDLDVALERLGVDPVAFYARWNWLRGRLGLDPVTPEDVRASTLLPQADRSAARQIGRMVRGKVINLGLIRHDRPGAA